MEGLTDMRESEASKIEGISGSGAPAGVSLFSDTLLEITKTGFLHRLRNRVTWVDRWLTNKMVDVVGNPPVRIYLWDNTEATPPVEKPMAILQYNNRSALLKTKICLLTCKYWTTRQVRNIRDS